MLVMYSAKCQEGKVVTEYFAVLVRSGLGRITYAMSDCYFISIVLFGCLIVSEENNFGHRLKL